MFVIPFLRYWNLKISKKLMIENIGYGFKYIKIKVSVRFGSNIFKEYRSAVWINELKKLVSNETSAGKLWDRWKVIEL